MYQLEENAVYLSHCSKKPTSSINCFFNITSHTEPSWVTQTCRRFSNDITTLYEYVFHLTSQSQLPQIRSEGRYIVVAMVQRLSRCMQQQHLITLPYGKSIHARKRKISFNGSKPWEMRRSTFMRLRTFQLNFLVTLLMLHFSRRSWHFGMYGLCCICKKGGLNLSQPNWMVSPPYEIDHSIQSLRIILLDVLGTMWLLFAMTLKNDIAVMPLKLWVKVARGFNEFTSERYATILGISLGFCSRSAADVMPPTQPSQVQVLEIASWESERLRSTKKGEN